jgi:hypothetical protein
MTVDVGDASHDLVGFVVFAAGNAVAFTGMGDAKHHDACVGFQHLAAASGLVTQAYEMSFGHC